MPFTCAFVALARETASPRARGLAQLGHACLVALLAVADAMARADVAHVEHKLWPLAPRLDVLRLPRQRRRGRRHPVVDRATLPMADAAWGVGGEVSSPAPCPDLAALPRRPRVLRCHCHPPNKKGPHRWRPFAFRSEYQYHTCAVWRRTIPYCLRRFPCRLPRSPARRRRPRRAPDAPRP